MLGVAATAGEAVGVHHTTIWQGVYLEAQGQWLSFLGLASPHGGLEGGLWSGQLWSRASSVPDVLLPVVHKVDEQLWWECSTLGKLQGREVAGLAKCRPLYSRT